MDYILLLLVVLCVDLIAVENYYGLVLPIILCMIVRWQLGTHTDKLEAQWRVLYQLTTRPPPGTNLKLEHPNHSEREQLE
jgi:cytochrome oxidase assembly protein ShyY1